MRDRKTESVRKEIVWVGSLGSLGVSRNVRVLFRRKNRVEVRHQRRDRCVEEG